MTFLLYYCKGENTNKDNFIPIQREISIFNTIYVYYYELKEVSFFHFLFIYFDTFIE